MTTCREFDSLRQEIDQKGRGDTLRKKLKSLKGTELIKRYMACMRSGKKSRRKSMKRSSRRKSMKRRSMKK